LKTEVGDLTEPERLADLEHAIVVAAQALVEVRFTDVSAIEAYGVLYRAVQAYNAFVAEMKKEGDDA
jgi:hypothetical protein